MALVPLFAEPGICKVNSAYASGKTAGGVKDRPAAGRYIDADHVRFVAGFPEKIGGWVSATATQMTGTPRAMTDFRDNNGNPQAGIGTDSHLYAFNAGTLTDITPVRTISIGTLASPITTTLNSTTVAVADAAQNLANGDFVFLNAPNAVGGLVINGWYPVSARSGTGYNITVPVAATAGAGPAGGTTVFNYPRVTLSNPFTTTNLSATVAVADANHGATTGDYVTFSGASAVAGLTLNGEFQLTVTGTNTYTITAPGPANAGTTGGGSVSVTYDITMEPLGALTPVVYGSGPYGVGPYGYSYTAVSTQFSGWTLAAYGATLLANPIGGTIYQFNPALGGRGFPVLNAPASVLAIFVTPERFLFALGITVPLGGTAATNAMQLAWPDQSDITNWTSLPTNTANSGRSMQGGTFFVGGIPVANGVSLFWSNRSTFEASYTGDNLVYATPLLSDSSGLIGPLAMTTMAGVAYWMSAHEFWMWNGTVQPLPSDDIRDYVFGNINTAAQSRCIAGTVRAKKEVWFRYPSAGSTECDRYVIYHVDQGIWSIGSMQRSAWLDSDLFPQPYGADPGGNLWIHESTVNAAGTALDAYIEYAPTDISNGDRNVDVFGFIPDFQRLVGDALLTINVRQYPQDPAQVLGPITVADDDSTPLLDFRADGKMVGYRLESNAVDGDFRFGLPRANVQPAGARL
jgi:hypothetical protein